jgi:hypothetical protein
MGLTILEFTASDVVAQAARTALEIRQHAPGVSVALATGAGPVRDLAHPERSVVTRAEALIDASASGIFLDQVSTGLLESRFQLERGDRGSSLLVGERLDPAPLRRLLGRSTPCVGRERELSVLESLLTESLSESVGGRWSPATPASANRVRYELLRRVARWPERAAPARSGSVADPVAEGSPFGIPAALSSGSSVLVTPETVRTCSSTGGTVLPNTAARGRCAAGVVAGGRESSTGMDPSRQTT